MSSKYSFVLFRDTRSSVLEESLQKLGIVKLRAHLDGRGKEGSKVELAENRLILSQIYSTPPPSPSIQIDY